MDITDLSAVDLKVGQQVSYHYKKHDSVGFTAEYLISDKTKLQFVEDQTDYTHPENMGEGMTGGDAATGLFIFQAAQPGETTLTVQHLFRGDLESEKQIKLKISG